MPTLNVDENIQKILEAIDAMTKEIFRLEGSLRVFRGFKEAGLNEVEVPEMPAPTQQAEEVMEAAPKDDLENITPVEDAQ